MTRKYSSRYFGLIMVCLALLGITANAQEPLNWPEARTFDSGEQISVGISRNGTYPIRDRGPSGFFMSDARRLIRNVSRKCARN